MVVPRSCVVSKLYAAVDLGGVGKIVIPVALPESSIRVTKNCAFIGIWLRTLIPSCSYRNVSDAASILVQSAMMRFASFRY